jgi:RNA polymerase sigma factor (sigma-70 family)
MAGSIEDVRQAQRGDLQAFERLVRRYRNLVDSIALSITRDPATSQDASQLTFVEMWKGLRRLRTPESFPAWLRQVARHRAYDVLRQRERRDRAHHGLASQPTPPSNTPDQLMLAQEELDLLQSALAEIPDDARDVLILYYREGQSIAQVADLLGIRPDAVKKRLSRARKALKEDVERRLGALLLVTAPGDALVARVTAAALTAQTGLAAGITAKSVVVSAVLIGVVGITGALLFRGSGPTTPGSSVPRGTQSRAHLSDAERHPVAAAPSPSLPSEAEPGEIDSDTLPATPVETQQTAPASDQRVAVAGAGRTLRGRVVFEGSPPKRRPLRMASDPFCDKNELLDESMLVDAEGGLANVVVRVISPGGIPVSPLEAPAELHQTDCRYEPRIQAVPAGSLLQVHNNDGTLHNVHAYRGRKTVFNKAQPPRARHIEELLEEGEILKFACDVHPWMSAFVVISDTPYAVTRPDGSFTLSGLPPGPVVLRAWHEKLGWLQLRTAAGPDPVELSYPAPE